MMRKLRFCLRLNLPSTILKQSFQLKWVKSKWYVKASLSHSVMIQSRAKKTVLCSWPSSQICKWQWSKGYRRMMQVHICWKKWEYGNGLTKTIKTICTRTFKWLQNFTWTTLIRGPWRMSLCLSPGIFRWHWPSSPDTLSKKSHWTVRRCSTSIWLLAWQWQSKRLRNEFWSQWSKHRYCQRLKKVSQSLQKRNLTIRGGVNTF